MKKLCFFVNLVYVLNTLPHTNDLPEAHRNYLRPWVNFEKSMYHYFTTQDQKTPYSSQVTPEWHIVKMLYERNNLGTIQPSPQPKIPKIIHQIWLGSPLPKQYKKYQKSWRHHHPDWEYKLWTDADVEAFQLHNKKLFDEAKNYGEKSDIFRYEILHRYGGVYIDTDIECLKPFDIFIIATIFMLEQPILER